MHETEVKSPSIRGMELEKDKPSPGAIPLSQGLRDHFGGSGPNDDQKAALSKIVECSLYSVGLHRLHDFADQLLESADQLSTNLDRGEYSVVDDLLDRLADISPWDRSEFRELLLRISLDDH